MAKTGKRNQYISAVSVCLGSSLHGDRRSDRTLSADYT